MKRKMITAAALALMLAMTNNLHAQKSNEQQKVEQTKKNSTEQAVLSTHKKLNENLVSGNLDELKKIYSPDYFLTNAIGQVWSREFFLNLISSGNLKMIELTIADEKVTIIDNIAIVTAQQNFKLTFGPNPMEGKERTTAIYHKKGINWILVTQQNTPIVEQQSK